MPKKSTDLKKFQVNNLSSLWGNPTVITYTEKDFDPHARSRVDLEEAEEKNKSKSLFSRLKEKVLPQRTNSENNAEHESEVQNIEPKEQNLDIISCHVCGTVCKGNDFFCSSCGAKLKVGHFNDKK